MSELRQESPEQRLQFAKAVQAEMKLVMQRYPTEIAALQAKLASLVETLKNAPATLARVELEISTLERQINSQGLGSAAPVKKAPKTLDERLAALKAKQRELEKLFTQEQLDEVNTMALKERIKNGS